MLTFDKTIAQLAKVKTPCRFKKIEQINNENSPQQIQLCTQCSLRSQN